MSKPPLGCLERVSPRTCREIEALDFTPWLTRGQNIALLTDIMGFDGPQVWMLDTMEAFDRAFGPRIRILERAEPEVRLDTFDA